MSKPLLFLDANIFIAAVASPKGGSRFLMDFAETGQIRIITVSHALREAERNISEKLDANAHTAYQKLLLRIPLIVHLLEDIPIGHAVNAERFVPPKDVPILLGALASHAQFLVTLDRKDFLSNRKLADTDLPFSIVTPDDFIQRYLS